MISSCTTLPKPKLDMCLMSPNERGIYCHKADGDFKYIPFDETEPMVCVEVSQFRDLINYCKAQSDM